MLENGIQFPGGDTFKAGKITATNRTGAALTQYGVYSLDFLQADAASTTAMKGIGNVVAAATANLAMPKVVYDDFKTVADDETTQFVFHGPTKALCNGSVSVGDYLKAVNGQAYFQAAGFAAGSVEVTWAIALEANTSATTARNVFMLGAPYSRNAASS